MSLVRHRTATVAGRSVFYREAGPGDAPTVLLLHGAPSSSHMFRHLMPQLADCFHVVAPDYIGFGNSDLPTVDQFEYSFDSLTDVVQTLLDTLGVDRYAMYVQDYGAPVGWRLALRDPSAVAAIVTQSGNAYVEGIVPSFWDPLWAYADDPSERNAAPLRAALSLQSIRWQYTHGVRDLTRVDPDAWLHDHRAVHRPGNLDVQLRLFGDYRSNLEMYPQVQAYFRSSQVPLMAVWGRNDEVFGAAGALAFRGDLPAAEIHLVDGGHWLLESHLDLVAGYVRGFLCRVLTESS